MRTSRRDHLRPAPGPVAAPTMTAVVQDRYGSVPDAVLRVEQVPVPTPTQDEVLVRVHAASIDRGTWHIMAGLPYPIRLAGFGVRRPRYANPGRSLAGTVAAIGDRVTAFAPGDPVFGVGEAAFAQYAVARPDRLSRMPADLSFEQAAAMPVSGSTALQAVRDHARVAAGERVLILGASGGVGTFAVQIAKASGAEVTGVCSTAKLAMVRALGADHVLDHTREDFADAGSHDDVILDTGGNTRLARLRRALTPQGRLVIVGGETDGRLLGGSGRQVRAQLLSPSVRQRLGTFITAETAADLLALSGLVEGGHVLPAIDRTFPLDAVAAALDHLLAGQARGKVVITIPSGTRAPGSGSTT